MVPATICSQIDILRAVWLLKIDDSLIDFGISETWWGTERQRFLDTNRDASYVQQFPI